MTTVRAVVWLPGQGCGAVPCRDAAATLLSPPVGLPKGILHRHVPPLTRRGFVEHGDQPAALRIDEVLLGRDPARPGVAAAQRLVPPPLDRERKQQYYAGDGEMQDRAKSATGARQHRRSDQQEAADGK